MLPNAPRPQPGTVGQIQLPQALERPEVRRQAGRRGSFLIYTHTKHNLIYSHTAGRRRGGYNLIYSHTAGRRRGGYNLIYSHTAAGRRRGGYTGPKLIYTHTKCIIDPSKFLLIIQEYTSTRTL
jgi:hypothetical protein